MSDCISIHAPPRGATWKPCKSRSNHLFQFTPLREGRRKAQSATAWHPYFNSRPSARGDVCGKYSDNSITISIHAPPRGATARDNALPKTWSISIHAPPRGATTGMMSVSAACVFQFTPLREGRRQIHVLRQTRHISIHAPPRGATRCNRHRSYRQQISIHAPPRGATRGGKSSEGSKNFNSRPSARGDPTSSRHERRRRPFQFTPLREGRPSKVVPSQEEEKFQFTPLREGRRERAEFAEFARPISIHAPPRGATAVSATMSRLRDFNSRPSARGDVGIRQQRVTVGISIHAPPRGATGCRQRGRQSNGYFNSRPSARGDDVAADRRFRVEISIHAPPRGATGGVIMERGSYEFQFTPLREGRRAAGTIGNGMILISIHAPPRGATARNSALSACIPNFNSRPSARGDARCAGTAARPTIFQFTPLREGRPAAAGDERRRIQISIHAPPRGATRRWFAPPRNSPPISIHAPPRGATALPRRE